ncbi:hypothetical protein EBT31_15560, partial [bacterium]|nr:hypothetical protein [bacterium]
ERTLVGGLGVVEGLLGGDHFSVGQVRTGVGGRAVVGGDDEAVDFRHALLGEGDGGRFHEVVREEAHAVFADVQRREAAGDLEVLEGDAGRGHGGVVAGRVAASTELGGGRGADQRDLDGLTGAGDGGGEDGREAVEDGQLVREGGDDALGQNGRGGSNRISHSVLGGD